MTPATGASPFESSGLKVGKAASSEAQLRAGARVLTLFTTPLNCLILRTLANGPLRLTDLRKEVGGPPQTTLRGHLGNLIEFGALEKRSPDGKPSTVENGLTQIGFELLYVAEVLEIWLSRAPEGSLGLESEPGKAATKALIGAWDSTMLRALAARPFSLTELDNLITALTYPSLERRLSALHLAGQVAAVPSADKGTPYAVTDWLRQGVAPLVAAARCECRHLSKETMPLGRIDIEALLLLAVPLLDLPAGTSGICQLAFESTEETRWRVAGVTLTVEKGAVVACTSKLEPDPATSVQGPISDWLDAILDGDAGRLAVDGDADLGGAAVGALNAALFGA
jgi:DNA-binding HxlR family transcriptional regulator